MQSDMQAEDKDRDECKDQDENIDEIEDASDTKHFHFTDAQIHELGRIIGGKWNGSRSEFIPTLNEIATDYLHQIIQGRPSREDGTQQLRKLAKYAKQVAVLLNDPEDSARERLWIDPTLRERASIRSDGGGVELFLQRLAQDLDLLHIAAARQGKVPRSGRPANATLHLAVARLADLYTQITQNSPTTLRDKSKPGGPVTAPAGLFVNRFFAIVQKERKLEPECRISSDAPANALDTLIKHRLKKPRRTRTPKPAK